MNPVPLMRRALRASACAIALVGPPAGAQNPPAETAPPPAPAAASAPDAVPVCPPPPSPPTPQQVAQAQQDARDRGLLWRIRKGGHDSYLFGTLHVGRFEWTVPGPQLAAAVRATDTLALELDVTDSATLQAMAQPPEAGLPTLPEALAQRLARQRTLACVPAGPFEQLHPMMQTVALAVLAARWEGLDPAFAQEFVLGGVARALGRPIVALETPQAQRDALVPRDPQRLVQVLDEALTRLENHRDRSIMRRLGQAWAQGDLADLERYTQWCDCLHSDEDRALLTRLLDARNPGMAQRIDALHQQGQRLLAAVGALHMVGPQGLPALLRERGFQVQRLHPPGP